MNLDFFLQSVGELKAVVVSQLGLTDIPDGGRLRVDDDNLGLKPPRKFEFNKNAFQTLVKTWPSQTSFAGGNNFGSLLSHSIEI